MKLDRRGALRLGAATGASAAALAVSGCSVITRRLTKVGPPESVDLPAADVAPIARLLNRAAFGPAPGQAAEVAATGIERWLDRQLNPDDEDSPIVTLRLVGLEALQIHAVELEDIAKEEVLRQLQQAAILRSVYSQWQLRERMVDLWSNHLNIYARKGNGFYFKPTDELKVVRANALGKFPDLLRASAHSPAMLMYLDNQVNRKKDSKGAGANENYARELMELHTLGVHGGYSQKDVQEVARCLTGWTVEDRFLHARGTFRFNPDLHDPSAKAVLGVHIPAKTDSAREVSYKGVKMPAGQVDGEQVLELLAAHPGTAKFISHKIARYFLGEAAPAWEPRLTEIYLKTGGDIREMIRPLILSDELRAGPPILKRPFDFMVSALRATNADTDANRAIQDHLSKMGQPLYQWPMPDGYPDKTTAWTGSLLARWNFALALMTGGIGGTTLDLPSLKVTESGGKAANRELVELILAAKAEAKSVQPILAKLDALPRAKVNERAALLLASPEFQWR
jgi:uncharacterized protein (DUF1800 family)